jgi:hypothetical protein
VRRRDGFRIVWKGAQPDPVKSNDNVTEQASFPQKIMSLNSHSSVKR